MTTQDNSFPIIRAGHDHWPGFLTKKNPTEEPGYDILWKVFPHTLSKDSMTHSLLLILFLFTIVVAIALKQNKWLIKLTELVPESGCLMIMGLVIALIAIKIDHIKDPLPLPLLWLDDWFIEHLLIAPIILHASYGLYHPHFFGQLGTILLLALLATVLNAIIIAVILFFLVPYIMDHDLMNFYHTITYGALISAVDPVAVLAVFDSLNANKALYYLVFGESLLNDGVTYVMYEGFKAFTTISSKEHDNISAGQFVLLSVSFLTKPLGGLLVGFIVGLLATFVAKNASDNTAYLKPLMNLMFASFAYSLALMFSFSGILCLIAFGLSQQRYTFRNMTHSAALNTTNLVRDIAVITETFLFFFLGTEFAVLDWPYMWAFAFTVLATIIFARAVVTFSLMFIVNKMSPHQPIDWKWQLIIVAGGLRGAIAFAMVIKYEGAPFEDLFKETTIFIIFVTTLIKGILAKPMVLLFKLRAEEGEENFDYDNFYGWTEEKRGCCGNLFKQLETKFIFPYFIKDEESPSVAAHMKVVIEEDKVFDKIDEEVHAPNPEDGKKDEGDFGDEEAQLPEKGKEGKKSKIPEDEKWGADKSIMHPKESEQEAINDENDVNERQVPEDEKDAENREAHPKETKSEEGSLSSKDSTTKGKGKDTPLKDEIELKDEKNIPEERI